MLVPSKLFQPSLIIADKAKAYPGVAPFRCSTLGEAPGLNNTQHNDIQHNDIQHNDIQYNDIQRNDIQPNDYPSKTYN